ncbi:protein KAKU4 isoform X2 [Malania oleifera]|uniref:protein KAKU4 isoform X2 n=1 Tax=Malania oleifera TaxID=397392 RepID=UPI0025ADDC21|nr:protein KAKU4 isoform X2 [Malania oleifera]
MATVPRSRRAAEARSGGKVVKPRRVFATRTPYDRPKVPSRASESPGWLSGLVFPAAGMIASGAGKLISTVFGSDSSSSSSSSSEESDSSFDVVEGGHDENDLSSQGAGWLNKTNGTPSEMVKHLSNEPQPVVGKNETKRIIEQLIMQETFSREESEKLIEIIKLRVIDSPAIEGGEYTTEQVVLLMNSHILLMFNYNYISDADMLDLCSTAVMEAKKWLKEKKLGSSSKSELDQRTCSLNTFLLPDVTETAMGSPVDMAKSYMRARPPWASPSVNIEYNSSSPIGMDLFKQETPHSIGGSSLSTPKLKRDSFAAGSWNILDEIRRVRSKATEEMLKDLPSTKIDLSAFSLEQKTSQNPAMGDKMESGIGDKMCNSNPLAAMQSADESLKLVTGVNASNDILDAEMAQDGLQNETLSSNPAISVCNRNQDLEAQQITDGRPHGTSESYQSGLSGFQDGSKERINSPRELLSSDIVLAVLQSDNVEGLKDNNGFNQQQLGSTVEGMLHDSRSNDDREQSQPKEITGLRGTDTANGFPSHGSSASAGKDAEPEPRASREQQRGSSSNDKRNTNAHMEEARELLSEASVEIPIANEADGAANDTHSQNSLSMTYDELPQETTKPYSRQSFPRKTSKSAAVERQQGKKPSRYTRKTRGKAK